MRDEEDHPRIQNRMVAFGKIMQDRGFPFETQELEGVNMWHKIFASLLCADWAAYYTALQYKVDPDKVPLVEEFKKLMQ